MVVQLQACPPVVDGLLLDPIPGMSSPRAAAKLFTPARLSGLTHTFRDGCDRLPRAKKATELNNHTGTRHLKVSGAWVFANLFLGVQFSFQAAS